ncbi:MAG: nucleotide exchange factor GrpE [Candidatus Omnitrophica bacterium]|nr:nucleotide exchange factor GrpE [Candidatus Omnitrophota bacterium]
MGSHPASNEGHDKSAHVVHDRRRRGDEGDASGAEAPNEIERLKQEAKDANDQYLRAVAEFENTKKRLHRERDEFSRYAAEAVLRELLPIIESLDQALVAVDQQSDPQAVIKGVHLIYRQLLGLLEKEGVKRIATVGERFDPHLHEAIAQVDAQDGQADGTIVEEVRIGYTMHGKVIRPAMVRVAKATSPQKKETPTKEGKEV